MSSATPGPTPTPDPSSVTPRVQAIIQALARPSTTESQYVLQTRLTSVIAVRPVLKPFRRAACWFALGIDPFTKLGDVLFTGVSVRVAPSTLADLDEANASMLASGELDDPESRP